MLQLTYLRQALRVTTLSSTALAAALMLTASSAQAQLTDTRWHTFAGCWKPVETTAIIGARASGAMVCVVPVANSQSVDIASISNDKVVHVERITGNGSQVPRTVDNCTGWQSASWAADGNRLYMRSEFACRDSLKVKSSTVYAIGADGNWMHIQGNSVGNNAEAMVSRFMPTDIVLAPDVVLADSATVRTVTAPSSFNERMIRVAAAKPIEAKDVLELSKNVDTQVAQAFVAEYGKPIQLNAKQLVALSEAGVSGDLIDIMIAKSNPERFMLQASNIANAPRPTSADINRGNAADCFSGFYSSPLACASLYGYPYGLMPWGLRNSMYGFGYGGYGYNQYGYSPYGWGNYGSGYYGNSPIIVVTRPGADDVRPQGRAVRGQGYTQNGSTGTGSRPATSSGASPSSPSTSSGSSGSSTSGGVGGGSSGGSTGRTAVPRTPPPSR